MLTLMSVRSGLQSYKTYEVAEVCAWVKSVWDFMRIGEKALIIESIQRSLTQDAHLPSTSKEWTRLVKFCLAAE